MAILCIIDCWGMCLDIEIPGAILSCNVVDTCGFSSHKSVTKYVSKQIKQVRIKNFRDQRTKSREQRNS